MHKTKRTFTFHVAEADSFDQFNKTCFLSFLCMNYKVIKYKSWLVIKSFYLSICSLQQLQHCRRLGKHLRQSST